MPAFDFSGLDIGAIIAGVAMIAKAFHSDKKTKIAKTEAETARAEAKSISEDRVISKRNYDERFAAQDERMKNVERRLDQGDIRLGALEKKIDDNFRDLKNDLLRYSGRVNYTMGLLEGSVHHKPTRKHGKQGDSL